MARAITRPKLKIAQKSEKLDISGPKTYQKLILAVATYLRPRIGIRICFQNQFEAVRRLMNTFKVDGLTRALTRQL